MQMTLLVFSVTAYSYNEDDCNLRFNTINDLYWTANSGAYSPKEGTRFVKHTISISNTGPHECNWYVTASTGRRGDNSYKRGAYNGTHMIEYFLVSSQNISSGNFIKDASSITKRSQVITGEPVGVGSTTEQTFFMAVANKQYVPAGVYNDTVSLKLYKQNPFSARSSVEDTALVNVTIPVESTIDLRVGGLNEDEHHAIDFDILENYEQINVQAGCVSSLPLRIDIRSRNSSNLVHLTNATSAVPFTVVYDSICPRETKNIDLSQGNYTLLTYDDVYDVECRGYEGYLRLFMLRLTIGEVPTTAMAGDYQDTIDIVCSDY